MVRPLEDLRNVEEQLEEEGALPDEDDLVPVRILEMLPEEGWVEASRIIKRGTDYYENNGGLPDRAKVYLASGQSLSTQFGRMEEEGYVRVDRDRTPHGYQLGPEGESLLEKM